MRLCYISVRRLIAEAGGDPWAINRTLQAGRPAQISFLAQAFHDGGQRTTDDDAAFDQARRRFEASWNRENGDHPINDAAEVLRATESLGVQATQLPKIAIDLERVAAVLAEVQRATVGQIRALEDSWRSSTTRSVTRSSSNTGPTFLARSQRRSVSTLPTSSSRPLARRPPPSNWSGTSATCTPSYCIV